MAVSRRAFVRNLAIAAPTAASLAARGREAWAAEHPFDDQQARQAADSRLAVRLNSNECPLGPGPSAVQAIEKAFAYSGRYPMNARPAIADLRALLAKQNGL